MTRRRLSRLPSCYCPSAPTRRFAMHRAKRLQRSRVGEVSTKLPRCWTMRRSKVQQACTVRHNRPRAKALRTSSSRRTLRNRAAGTQLCRAEGPCGTLVRDIKLQYFQYVTRYTSFDVSWISIAFLGDFTISLSFGILHQRTSAVRSKLTSQSYTGGCQCGKVRYEVQLDINEVLSCNCSRCGRLGSLLAFASASQFKLTQGANDLTTYEFNRHMIQHKFCSTCGIQSFAIGKHPKTGESLQAIVSESRSPAHSGLGRHLLCRGRSVDEASVPCEIQW
jgi:hypothetical protein